MDIKGIFNFSPEQETAFKEFQKRMIELFGSEADDDYKLYRFLRARDFDVNQAEVMFRKHVAWRKKIKIQTILEDYQMNEVRKKYFHINVIGCDKKGYLVGYIHGGNVDFKGLMSSGKISTYIKDLTCLVTGCEVIMKELSQRFGKPIEKWSLIMDIENISLTQVIHRLTVEFLLSTFFEYEANYPERLESAIVINASSVFPLIFNIFKPVLPSRTLSKLKIFGKDGWKEELLNFIDAETLPAFLGGERRDPDGNPLCTETFRFNGPVPRKYYFRSPERRLRGKPGVKECVLKKLDKNEIVLELDEPGSSIEWEFETETGDIAFGLFRRKHNGSTAELEPIIPIQRVDAGTLIEKDSFVCDTAGIYIFVLDNTYSWIREKQVFYKLSVKKATEPKSNDALVENLRKHIK